MEGSVDFLDRRPFPEESVHELETVEEFEENPLARG
jgi:hypothetical protein